MRAEILICSVLFCLLASFPIHAWEDDGCYHPPNSPLIVDVRGDDIKLGPKGVGVYFDLYATGAPIHMQWVRAHGDEAFLVADLNGNGIVDNGGELFGVGTELVFEGEQATNGYIALQQYDSPSLGGNDDGQISNLDTIWSMLKLWTDRNADGRSVPSEMQTPQALGLTAFGTIPKLSKRVDEAGNTMPFYSWVSRSKGKKVLMVDVFFVGLP